MSYKTRRRIQHHMTAEMQAYRDRLKPEVMRRCPQNLECLPVTLRKKVLSIFARDTARRLGLYYQTVLRWVEEK